MTVIPHLKEMYAGQWHDQDITSRTLRTLEKCPSGNENNVEIFKKLHGVIEGMLVHHNHVPYRSNSKIEFFLI
jgi:hypothetical protein